MIDVIIPCFNAEQTLQRAVQSVLNQPELGTLWLVDDGSSDNTLALANYFARQYPQKIRVERMPQNGGAAKARNWAALQSQAEFVAFLDADDAYEPNALQVAEAIFRFQPETAVVRLALKPVGLDERYLSHADFEYAWQVMQMTGAGNTVFHRAFFLACGGFPQHDLFRRFGGEDGALGVATTMLGKVSTAFDQPGVLNYCHAGMHSEHLLDAILFGKSRVDIQAEHHTQADRITDQIYAQVQGLKQRLNSNNIGACPMILSWK